MHSIEEIKCLRSLWDSFSREWQVVLKSNIFNWYNAENEKIINSDYVLTGDENEEPWYNHEYKLTDEELQKVFRIKYLSTVIGDATPWGGSEYTPNIDLSILRFFRNMEYLDISCYFEESEPWEDFIKRCPTIPTVNTFRCNFNKIKDLSFVSSIFPNLKLLDCSYNEISSLKSLDGLKLVALVCSETNITKAEINGFLESHPFCKIINHEYDPELILQDTFNYNK